VKRILLTGRNGQVGYELERSLAPLGEVLACEEERGDRAQRDGPARPPHRAYPFR